MIHLRKITVTILTILLLCITTGCSSDGEFTALSESVFKDNVSVEFDCYLQRTHSGESTRATVPLNANGAIDATRLLSLSFGVFSQYTSNTALADYTVEEPFNFMWNQQVNYDDDHWTYLPVKFWPNDNQPADDQDPAAQGSQEHSYLSFFAYAPYTSKSDLDDDYDVTSDATADGIVKISPNTEQNGSAYIYYRTSNELPFGVSESVDLLWATQQNRYKMDGGGAVNGSVDLLFKHALTKLNINTLLYVDRTADATSDAYSTSLDANTRIFIDNATITTPDYYKEGKLMIAPRATVPTWDYTGVDDAKKLTGFTFDSNTDNLVEDVKYSLRYASPNVPANYSITDENGDGLDDETGLSLLETAQAAFAAMQEGVTSSEQRLAANYSAYIFPPTSGTKDITIHVVYHVVTFDEKLILNNPKYYSNVTNDITATLGNDDFKFEPNKEYKILLNLGVTSAKFDVSVLDESGEYILLSSVVKSWDEKVVEGDVK